MDKQNIFVSYSRKDSEFALHLYEDLLSQGSLPWIDEKNITKGNLWDKEIEAALKISSYVLFIVSAASVESDNVMDEVHYAISAKKKVIPVILEACELPYRVQRIQSIDFSDSYDAGLKKLYEVLSPATGDRKNNPITGIEAALLEADLAFDTQNFEKAVPIFLQYEQYLTAAQCARLGWVYDSDRGSYYDNRTAIEWYSKAAEKGDIAANYDVGSLLLAQDNSQDNLSALYWFYRGAILGDATCMFELGDMIVLGICVKQDFSLAFTWLLKAADEGNEYAFVTVGDAYETGRGIKQDYRKAMEYYLKGSQKGYPYAMVALAVFLMGDHPLRDNELGLNWLYKAAAGGFGIAMNNLGMVYEEGEIVKQDYKIAMDWYLRAADRQVKESMFHLGTMFELGRGVKKDINLAVTWFKKALAAGDESAEAKLLALSKKK